MCFLYICNFIVNVLIKNQIIENQLKGKVKRIDKMIKLNIDVYGKTPPIAGVAFGGIVMGISYFIGYNAGQRTCKICDKHSCDMLDYTYDNDDESYSIIE